MEKILNRIVLGVALFSVICFGSCKKAEKAAKPTDGIEMPTPSVDNVNNIDPAVKK
jgi:hypothetical protein